MQSLFRHFDFRPHGDRLLTSSAAFWLFSARVLVFAMASAEAVAWGYLGFVLSEGLVRWVTAAFTAVIIFLVVWMIDVSLITMDRAWSEHARTILGQPEKGRRGWRDILTFSLRIGLLVGSLTVTAPYLAQLVFYRDIEQFNENLTIARIDSARARLTERYDSAVSAKQQELDLRRTEYEREIAGQGPSGRFGSGPTAAAMERTIAKLEAERDALRHQGEQELAQFETLARSPQGNRERLATRYNLTLPEQTILGNYAVLRELRERPEHQQTEFAIKAFLAFIFSGLLLLKLFEPYSVRLYFSEVLQQEYARYLAGSFDDVLPAAEQSTSKGATAMSPQRLYAFLANVWAPARLLEEKQAESKAQVAAAANALETVERMRDAAIRELNRRKEDVARLTRSRDEAVLAVTQLRSAIQVVRTDVQNIDGKLQTLAVRPERLDELSWLEHRSTLSRKLADARRALRELEESAPTEENRHERSESELAEALKGLHDSTMELQAVEKQLREMRGLLASVMHDRAKSALKAV